MAGMIKSMFGKTVSELTAERQKRTDEIVQRIMSGAGNTQYEQNVARLGGNLGVWGGTKLGNWFSGGDKRLEAAEAVDARQLQHNELLANLDWNDPTALHGLADIQFKEGEYDKGKATTALIRQAEARKEEDDYYDSMGTKPRNDALAIANINGNYALAKKLEAANRRAAAVDTNKAVAPSYGGGSLIPDGIGDTYITNAPTDAENIMFKYDSGEPISAEEYKIIAPILSQTDDEKKDIIRQGKPASF
tara:strand:+ start:366 stop:1109 length:744 start_codon:yes stop_codon:yes gene_type:complete